MTSKSSFLVNLRTNAKRRVWLVVSMFLVFLFVLPMATAISLNVEKMSYPYRNLSEHLGRVFCNQVGISEGMAILISVMGIAAAVQGFSYMYSRSKLDLYMSVPVTRKMRFWAIYTNGILAFLVPYLVCVALSFLTAAALGARVSVAAAPAAAGILANVILYLAVYHLGILAVMLTGNIIVTFMAAGTLLFYDWIWDAVLQNYMSYFFSSYYYKTGVTMNRFLVTPLVRFCIFAQEVVPYDYRRGFQTLHPEKLPGFLLPMAVFGIAVLALAYWCYTQKPSESCGRSLAFVKTRGIIKLLLLVPASLTAGVIMYEWSRFSKAFCVFGILLGLLLSHGAVEVIYDFDLRSIKNGWRTLLLATGVTAFLFAIFPLDLFGYDRYVPKADDLQEAAVIFPSAYTPRYDDALNGVDPGNYIFENMHMKNTAPILKLASKWMGTKADYEDEESRYLIQIPVQYTLKSGRKVYRCFYADSRQDTELYDSILLDEDYQKAFYIVYDEITMDLLSRLKMYYNSGSGKKIVSGVPMGQLAEAYRQDLKGLDFTTELEERVRGMVQMEGLWDNNYYYGNLPVYPSFHNTIALLEKAGVYEEEYVRADEVDRIVVTNYHTELQREASQEEDNEYSAYQDFSTTAVIDDPAEIAQIVSALYPDTFSEFWRPMDLTDENYYLTVYFKQNTVEDESYVQYYGILNGAAPKFLDERTAYTENS